MRKRAENRSLKNTKPTSATQIGAVLPSSVAMPTPIIVSAQCQTMRSKARKNAATWMPAQPRQLMCGNLRSSRLRAVAQRPIAMTGRGRAIRKKAVEIGPTSDSLTNIPEKEIDTAPSSRIGSASRSVRVRSARACGVFIPVGLASSTRRRASSMLAAIFRSILRSCRTLSPHRRSPHCWVRTIRRRSPSFIAKDARNL